MRSFINSTEQVCTTKRNADQANSWAETSRKTMAVEKHYKAISSQNIGVQAFLTNPLASSGFCYVAALSGLRLRASRLQVGSLSQSPRKGPGLVFKACGCLQISLAIPTGPTTTPEHEDPYVYIHIYICISSIPYSLHGIRYITTRISGTMVSGIYLVLGLRIGMLVFGAPRP